MDVQDDQSPQGNPVLHVQLAPDQLDNVVNLAVVELVILVESLSAGLDGRRHVFGPVELGDTEDCLARVGSHPVYTPRFCVVVRCFDDHLDEEDSAC